MFQDSHSHLFLFADIQQISTMRALLFVTVILAVALGTFGREITNRVVGGEDAPDGKYPFQVSLRVTSHFCGGSILNKRWILTAAHCISGQSARRVKVSAGTNLLSEKGVVYQADLLIVHAKYNPYAFSNDIGLIRVNEDIVFSATVQPIKLAENNPAESNYPATLSGWGSTWLGGPAPDRLQHIQLTVISEKQCQGYHSMVTPSHICTLTKSGEGACHGDSGGPLSVDGVQIGIVSFGRPCAIGYPDVFTRVTAFNEWINEKIEQNS